MRRRASQLGRNLREKKSPGTGPGLSRLRRSFRSRLLALRRSVLGKYGTEDRGQHLRIIGVGSGIRDRGASPVDVARVAVGVCRREQLVGATLLDLRSQG